MRETSSQALHQMSMDTLRLVSEKTYPKFCPGSPVPNYELSGCIISLRLRDPRGEHYRQGIPEDGHVVRMAIPRCGRAGG